MFDRIVESHQETAFDTEEQAEQFAADARAPAGLRYRGFLKMLKELQIRGRYLDVGAGPGVLAVLTARLHQDIHITAVEPSSAMISVGEQIIRENELDGRIRYTPGAIEDPNLPAGLGTFDLVYTSFALHHFADPLQALRILLGLVSDGGTLVIYDLRRVYWLYPVPIRNGFFTSIRAAYRPAEIRRMMAELRVSDYELRTFFPGFLQGLIIRKAGVDPAQRLR